MNKSELSPTASRAIEAYGGLEFWKGIRFVEAEASVGGLAFPLKRRNKFNHVAIRVSTDMPYAEISPIGRGENSTGILEGTDVKLTDKNGELIAERKNPRTYFPGGRRLFCWDDLDMAYFANYAFWNYLTLPRLLLNAEIKWTELYPGVLNAEFPDHIPTHCSTQEFHFDTQTGRLLQHNYSVDIISRFATAAHVIHAHGESGGIAFPSKRVVTPKARSGKAMKGPVLIDITIHRMGFISGQSA